MPIIYTQPIIIPPPPNLSSLRAVFDLDDTLWPQMNRAYAGTPYSIAMMDTFSITENKAFSTQDAVIILNRFKDPQFFTDIEFYPGVEKIRQLHDLKIRIGIKTNSLTEAVMQTKDPQLKATFPYLRAEDIEHQVTTHARVKEGKLIGPDVTFFVDDNPHNIIKSDAYANFLPAQPYNSGPKEIERMQGKNFYLMKDFDTIITTLIISVESWLGGRDSF